MLAGLVRRMMDRWPDLLAREAIRGLSTIDWRMHQGPWRHLLSIYDSEQDRWKMRTDKEAQQVASNLLDFITGVVKHDEATLATLKQNWADLLQNPDPGYKDSAWGAVRKIASSFANARK